MINDTFLSGDDKPTRKVYTVYVLILMAFIILTPSVLNFIEKTINGETNDESMVFVILLVVLFVHVLVLLLPFHLLVIYKRLKALKILWAFGFLPIAILLIYLFNLIYVGLGIIILMMGLGILPNNDKD